MKADIVPSVSHARRSCGKDKKVVVRCRQGVVDIYPRPETRNPNTPEQQRTRTTFGENAAKWSELPAEVKAGWNSFAAAHGRAFGRPSAEPMTGYRLYKSAAFFRELLELGDPPSAPAGLPLPLPERVELLPSAEPDTLRLRLEHKLKPGRFSVVVSMTPPTLRPSRKPDERNKRYVKGLNAASTAPLPPSGGEVTFTACRSSVASGQRFGVWMRIIRHEDGLASEELALDFIRPEGEEDRAPAAAPRPVEQPTPATPLLRPREQGLQVGGIAQNPGRRRCARARAAISMTNCPIGAQARAAVRSGAPGRAVALCRPAQVVQTARASNHRIFCSFIHQWRTGRRAAERFHPPRRPGRHSPRQMPVSGQSASPFAAGGFGATPITGILPRAIKGTLLDPLCFGLRGMTSGCVDRTRAGKEPGHPRGVYSPAITAGFSLRRTG